MTKMKKLLAILLTLSMIFGLCACGDKPENKPDEPITPSVHIELDDWPRVDGALACLPYYEEMASLLLGLDIEEARQYVMDNNTPASFKEIAEGNADLIFCLHASEEQDAYAKANGVELNYTPYALDAFVFFVNKDNPVDSISKQDLHDIYAGKITNWKELGGNDEPIIAYQRNEGSGSQTGLYQYLISESEVMNPPTEQRIGDMGGIIDAVAYYDNAKGAIGYSYLYFVTNQHFDEDIKLVKVDGIEPTADNIRMGLYPMVTEYCCVTTEAIRSDANSAVNKIIDWCASPDGQKLASKLSYVAAYGEE